jgi:SAM-dependent methyltransferase
VGKKSNYGIDRPDIVAVFAGTGLFSLAMTAVSFFHPEPGISFGLSLLAFAGWFVLGSKFVKPRAARRLLDSVEWRGDESVLDIGCGRGLLLVSAAKRVPHGRAVGIDIWNRRLQSGNSPSRTLENAKIEGVSDRVAVMDGDARHLPFADAAFDLVSTSLVFHNIPEVDRPRALDEAVRVLKPRGTLAMIELSHGKQFASILGDGGMYDVLLSSPQFLLFFGTRTLRARKK